MKAATYTEADLGPAFKTPKVGSPVPPTPPAEKSRSAKLDAHPITRLPELVAFRKIRAERAALKKEAEARTRRHEPEDRAAAEAAVRAAEAEVVRIEALVEIGRAKPADLAAAQEAVTELVSNSARQLERETERGRQKAAVQFEATRGDFDAAKEALRSAVAKYTEADVKELRELIRKAQAINQRITEAEDAARRAAPTAPLPVRQFQTGLPRQLDLWLAKVES